MKPFPISSEADVQGKDDILILGDHRKVVCGERHKVLVADGEVLDCAAVGSNLCLPLVMRNQSSSYN